MEKNVKEKVLIGRPLASIDSIVSHYCNDNFLAFYISNNKAPLNFNMRNQQKIKLTKRKTHWLGHLLLVSWNHSSNPGAGLFHARVVVFNFN